MDSVVSTLDVVNCKSTQIQLNGNVPTVVIDKSDGLALFLGKDNENIEIFTAKSSEINVNVLVGDDYKEYPVAEQLRTVIGPQKLITTPVEHSG